MSADSCLFPTGWPVLSFAVMYLSVCSDVVWHNISPSFVQVFFVLSTAEVRHSVKSLRESLRPNPAHGFGRVYQPGWVSFQSVCCLPLLVYVVIYSPGI